MIRLENVSKAFTVNGQTFTAVKPTNLHIRPGEIHGIIGFSGAGKSTLLRMINLLERPSSGKVLVNGINLVEESNLSLHRRQIGMIFQHFNLLNNCTVAKNVAFPLELTQTDRCKERVQDCLEIVGLSDKSTSYPSQLSGGQKQRVAIARALATQPSVLLCDEPTSALDPYTTREILEVLAQINQTLGVTIVMVSHAMSVVRALCDTVSVMDKGRIVETLDLNQEALVVETDVARSLLDDLPTRIVRQRSH